MPSGREEGRLLRGRAAREPAPKQRRNRADAGPLSPPPPTPPSGLLPASHWLSPRENQPIGEEDAGAACRAQGGQREGLGTGKKVENYLPLGSSEDHGPPGS